MENPITNKGVNNIYPGLTIPPLAAEGLALGVKCAFAPRASLDRLQQEATQFTNSLRNRAFSAEEGLFTTEDTPAKQFYVKTGTGIERNFQFDLYSYAGHLRDFERNLKQDLEKLVKTVPDRPPLILSRAARLAVKELVEDPRITFQNADKGLGLCLMETSWYLAQGAKTLSNGYTPVTPEAVSSTVRACWSKLRPKLLADAKISDPDTRKYILQMPPEKHSIPVLYLMPKLHKTPVGTRPIVAGHSYFLTPLARFLDSVYAPTYADSSIILKDSSTLIRQIEQMRVVDKDCILASADISNLYGEIPLPQLIMLCKQKLPTYGALAWLVLDHSFVQFNGSMYKQTTGVAMGSPFGPTAANLFLHHYIDPMLADPAVFPEILYVRRYLDDVLFVLRGDTQLQVFQQRLNSIHPRMKFSLEASPQSTDFLDLTVYKGSRFATSGVLDLRTFQKPMNRFLYIPYKTFHRQTSLVGFIGTEVRRFARNSSDEAAFLDTLLFFIQNLRARGYPAHFIAKSIHGITYARRAEFLTPRPKAPPTFSNRASFYVTHLAHHTKLKAFRALIHRHMDSLRSMTTAAGAPRSLVTVVRAIERTVIAYRRSPTLHQLVINNKPPSAAGPPRQAPAPRALNPNNP